MKVALTLIVVQQNPNVQYSHDDFFKFLLTEDGQFPSKYISTKDITDTARDLFSEYVSVYFDWTSIELMDFRKVNTTDCEVVYAIKLPNLLGIEKRGKFVSHNNKPNFESFYGRILSRKFRIF
jgi:hypothetical protein